MDSTGKYCAFLRGINVHGRKMRLKEVCSVFDEAGMREVESVLATGNILFQSERPRSALKGILQKTLTYHYADPVFLFVKTAEEIGAMLQNCPFQPTEDLHTYVFVCDPGFETRLIALFHSIVPIEREAARLSHGVFYWQVPKGATLNAGFSPILARKELQSLFTSRNLNTIAKINAKQSP